MKNPVVTPEHGSFSHDNVTLEAASIAHDNARFDDAERANFDILTELCSRMDNGKRVYAHGGRTGDREVEMGSSGLDA